MNPDLCVIFDWDGVIVDSSRLHEKSWEVLAAREGRDLPRGHFKRGFGMKNEVVIPDVLGWASDPTEVERIARVKELTYRELVADEGIELIPGTLEFLKTLRDESVACAVASSTRRANVDCVMDRMALWPFFDAIVTGDEVSLGKPAPDIFLEAAKRLGRRPADCVVFEDSIPGIQAALAAGMRLVALATTNAPELLRDADMVAADFRDISPASLRALFASADVRGPAGQA